MTHTFTEIETLARRLCEERGGSWDKRRAYWTRKALEKLDEPVLVVFGKLHRQLYVFGSVK